MDDLLPDFLAESNEHLEMLDRELVRFEAEPDNHETLRHIFRVVHTIKGTCGFLNLPRLEALAHAAETLMGRFRDGVPVSRQAVTVILAALDRIKLIMAELGLAGREPEGSDGDLIERLEALSRATEAPPVVVQTLERPLKPGEVPLDDLERAFRETEVEESFAPAPPEPSPDEPRRDELRLGEAAALRPDESIAAAEPVDAVAAPQAQPASLRVNVETLERLMTMVSELVLTRNQLMDMARQGQDQTFKVPLQRLSQVTGELQDAVMKTRMQPIGQAWGKLPRIVRDLAQELGKSIDLRLEGGETELDRQVLELIRDPLTHIVRNSSDHGIELPEQRLAAGKPATGMIHLTAQHADGAITISITDDGRGLDLPRIRLKAQAQGLASADDLARMSDQQVARLIFHPGLSTAEQITGISGRGVGMDVVKSNIDAIGGSIDITTARGRGTTLTLRLPLTLAIISALIVEAGGERFCIPQVAVRELVRLGRNGVAIEHLNGAPVMRLRQQLVPVAGLDRVLGLTDGAADDGGYAVMMQAGGRMFGVVVDAILQTEDIVVKPMARALGALKLFAGNTILGDGSVVLILEPVRLADIIAGEAQEVEQPVWDEAAATRDARTTLLIFRAGDATPKALPLSVITRLEDVDATSIEYSGGRPLLQYRGELIPIIPAHDAMTLRREGLQPLIVISDGMRSMGLAIDSIIDIADDRLDVADTMSGSGHLIGRAVIRGRATDILDIAHYLPQAHADWLTPRRPQAATVRQRLLLIEASDFLRDMLVPVLDAAGFGVRSAPDAAQAEAWLASGGFDAVLIDLDGADAAAQIALAGHGVSTTVIALATFAMPDQIELCRRAGITDIVTKLDRQALLGALHGAMGHCDRTAA